MSIDTDRRVRELEQRFTALEARMKELEKVEQQSGILTLKQKATAKAKQLMDLV